MWPLTPLTTYSPGSTPAIKGTDLNAFQAGTNGIVAGTFTLGSVTVGGGPGGATVTLPGPDSPRMLALDAVGNNRWLIDHNGFAMGRISRFYRRHRALVWSFCGVAALGLL
jgi:hypothetical protein